MTLKQAKKLKVGQIIYDSLLPKQPNNLIRRWKVNGKVQTWKRDDSRVKVPIKYGLYNFAYLTENNLNGFHLTEERARKKLESEISKKGA
jgi:hypothetical protein